MDVIKGCNFLSLSHWLFQTLERVIGCLLWQKIGMKYDVKYSPFPKVVFAFTFVPPFTSTPPLSQLPFGRWRHVKDLSVVLPNPEDEMSSVWDCLAVRLDFVSSSTTHLELTIFVNLEPVTKGTPSVVLTHEGPEQPVQLGSVTAVSPLLGWVLWADGHLPFWRWGRTTMCFHLPFGRCFLVSLPWEGFFPHFLWLDTGLFHGERGARVTFCLFPRASSVTPLHLVIILSSCAMSQPQFWGGSS